MALDPLDTRLVYTGLIGLVALQRLAELAVSKRNVRRALAAGALEVGRGHYSVMVAAHTAFLIACIAEVWWLPRPFLPALGVPMLGLLVVATLLRVWAIATLGSRWTTRVIVFPGAAPVTRGPYRFIRHPNYVAVILEFVALPLVHTAWLTALLGSLANALVLRARILVEEGALAAYSGYTKEFAGRPRFVPRGEGGA